jgi:hypothetical protein
MSHFSAIGFPVASPEDMQRTVSEALAAGGPPPWSGAAADRHIWYRDAAGPAIAAHVDDEQRVECLTPFFFEPGGGARWRVRTTAPHLDRECAHCSGADCDILDGASGALVTRATIQWLFFEPYRAWLGAPREFELQVVGFASSLVLGDAADIERAQAELFGPRDDAAVGEAKRPIRLADQAFMPTGMFGAEGNLAQGARALFTGRVVSAARVSNTLSKQPFLHVRIRTLGGEIDVVSDELPPPDAPPPQLALADVWLVGHPTEPPPAPRSKRGLLSLLKGGR